jgi:hypothetical protein
MREDIEAADTDLSNRSKRSLMREITHDEIVGGEVNARTSGFSLDLCEYGPFVRMPTIIDRPVVHLLGNVVRFDINGA